ncbi:MAG: hypothetical protein JWS12_362 [Candidatus Saccharibacteria bacterium]|nr:hypothetical protein [Candidatus Saccharibacteria bacterium]
MSKGWMQDKDIFVNVISQLNDEYKVKVYGIEFFEHGGPHNTNWGYEECCKTPAAKDFFRIIRTQDENVVLELLSMYANSLIQSYYLKNDPTPENIVDAYETFDHFCNAVNDVFEHFGVNLRLTRQSFIPKQEKIVEEFVIEPTFKALAGKQWEPVQNEIADAINEYHKGNKKAYSNAITHLVTALQAFLQIKVNSVIGKGDIDGLIRTGIANKQLPDDQLSKKVIDGLKSTLMEYRQKQGDAHPKAVYANEKSVRLILNTLAVFIQHCID